MLIKNKNRKKNTKTIKTKISTYKPKFFDEHAGEISIKNSLYGPSHMIINIDKQSINPQTEFYTELMHHLPIKCSAE